jgi:hypothetical protein
MRARGVANYENIDKSQASQVLGNGVDPSRARSTFDPLSRGLATASMGFFRHFWKHLQRSVIPALRQAQDRLAFGQAGIQVLVSI